MMEHNTSVQTKYLKKMKSCEVPFYAIPQASKTSAEIINEARASIKTVNTRRPCTPREENRRLFGRSSGAVQRPPSSFSLGRLHYESGDSRPISAALRLEPLGHNPVLKLSPSISETTTCSTSPADNHSDSARRRLPSITGEKGISLENYFSIILPDGLTAKSLRRIRRHSQPTINTKFEFPLREQPTNDNVENSFESDGNNIHGSLNTVNQRTDISNLNSKIPQTEVLEDDVYKKKILPLLDEMFPNSSAVTDKIHISSIIKQLYENLESTGLLGRSFSQRATILKVLYKMLDSTDHLVQLRLARLILAMKVSGNNLSNLCKLIFKITRNESNDQLFLEDNLLELFLQSIQKMNPKQDAEALVYSVGALKFLSMNSIFIKELSQLGCITLLSSLMATINLLKSDSIKLSQQTGHVLFQITGCLRNLAESSANRHVFISSGTIDQLCLSLELFIHDVDIITNIARILSKLTMHSDVCAIVSNHPNSFQAMVVLMQKYQERQELVVRLGFILGNLTAKNDEARILLFSQAESLETLLSLIERYMMTNTDETPDKLDKNIEGNNQNFVNNKDVSTSDNEDVIVKTIRVIANMSIHPDVGPIIATSDTCVNLILFILRDKKITDACEELALSALATLNNLSYYSLEKGAVAARQLEISECLMKLMLQENSTELVEVSRVFGNLTRSYEVRQFLIDFKVLEMMIALLDSGNKELVFTSCGVLINFMSDEDKRCILRNEGGIRKLIDVLKDFGSSDWQLASMVCQTLWNYTTKISSVLNVLTDGEILELVSVLEEYLNENFAMEASCDEKMDQITHENIHDQWTYTFCPVAENLLKRIEKFFISDQSSNKTKSNGSLLSNALLNS